MRTISIIAALTAASTSFASSAANPASEDSASANVFVETSHTSESMDAFISRIAERALAITFERDQALCGLIGKDSRGQLSLQLVNSGSPWRCNLRTDALQPGAEWTGLVFRTHTRRAADDWTASDMRHPGYLATEQKLTYRNANKWRKLADY